MLTGEEIPVDLQLDLLAMNLTNDPNPVRFDGKPPEFKPEPVLLASLFDITGILARSVVANTGNGEAIYYYINDHLGTPQKIVDESGAVVWQADYLPFGDVNVTVDAVGNEFRFPGQYYDQETGLHYNYHRYYDHSVGKYLTADPVGLIAGINLYVYVKNNPINFMDPQGLQSDSFEWREYTMDPEKEEDCFSLPSLKTGWEEGCSTERWEKSGEKVLMTGVSGACYWSKVKRGTKKREITPRMLCPSFYAKGKYYVKEGKKYVERKSFEKVVDTEITPMRWVTPIGGFAWIYECNRNYRSPFLPNKD